MLPNKNNFRVITFGCRLNFWETEVIKDHLDSKCSSQITVFNTCSVTSEAERKAKKAIRKIKALNPHSKIIVTGCAAQINPETWSAMPEVNYVVGNKEKVNKDFWISFFKNESLIKQHSQHYRPLKSSLSNQNKTNIDSGRWGREICNCAPKI